LVIANPPYVRYQSLSGHAEEGLALKSGDGVRQSLKETIGSFSHLSEEENDCFKAIIDGYSGLSDLAVPSWILCAALTRQGGTLAMVVPESWMSRDYALSIRYMLLKLFNVLFVVEDMNSAWFPGALVKTNLVVAKRIGMRKSIHRIADINYTHASLPASLIGQGSLVENLMFEGKKGLPAFLQMLDSSAPSAQGVEAKRLPMSTLEANSRTFEKLLDKLGEKIKYGHGIEIHTGLDKSCQEALSNATQNSIPNELSQLTGSCSILGSSLADWGFKVGQGLRTGANAFFYAEQIGSGDGFELLEVDRAFGGKAVRVSERHCLPALRHQSDIRDKRRISKEMLSHRLIYVKDELFSSSGMLRDPSDDELVSHIWEVEATPVVCTGKTSFIPELSAVKVNIRTEARGEGTIQRRWFMLPELAKRHLPQLCVPRVNHLSPRCILVGEGVAVDANFSTLWMDMADEKMAHAMFALLNSFWTQAFFEASGSVMGGGALKLEAAHIRRLVLPSPDGGLVSSLACLGESLAGRGVSDGESVVLEINRKILGALLGRDAVSDSCGKLSAYLQSKISGRHKNGASSKGV
jgi:hypothetical protein